MPLDHVQDHASYRRARERQHGLTGPDDAGLLPPAQRPRLGRHPQPRSHLTYNNAVATFDATAIRPLVAVDLNSVNTKGKT